MLRRCLRAMKVDEEEALYVGDMVLDVETASRAGVPVILVPGGSSPERELRSTGKPVLRSLAGLLELLQGATFRS
jgi:phosphoglycolate phosphatase-like HAD superfamily hydrolase